MRTHDNLMRTHAARMEQQQERLHAQMSAVISQVHALQQSDDTAAVGNGDPVTTANCGSLEA